MLEFPQQSIDRAREIVSHYNKRTTSKLKKAKFIYDGSFFEFEYGFNEAIKSGNCGKYLHEIVKDCDCFVMAGALYLIAKQAGLNPELYESHEMKDIDEGEKPEDRPLLDHTFITASLRKNKIHILDPDMNLFGEATFYPNINEIKVYNKRKNRLTLRKYASLQKLSEQDYLKKLQEARSSEGGRKALTGTQRLKTSAKKYNFITYLPETHSLRSSMRIGRGLFGPEPYSRSLVIDLITQVSNNGKFDFDNGDFNFYYVKEVGWSEHEIPQVPFVFSVKDAKKIWDIWESIAFKSGRKSPVYGMNVWKLEEMVLKAGLEEDFSIKKNSKAERLIKGDLKKDFNSFIVTKDKSINEFIPRCCKDEISYRTLLRTAQFVKARNLAKSPQNPYGLLFSEEEHLKILRNEFEKYKQGLKALLKILENSTEVKCGLRKGSFYHQDRNSQSSLTRFDAMGKFLETMGGIKKYDPPIAFSIFADKFLFEQTINIESDSINKLKKGLFSNDLKKAAQHKLYNYLLSSLVSQRELFLAQYKKGLERILNKEN